MPPRTRRPLGPLLALSALLVTGCGRAAPPAPVPPVGLSGAWYARFELASSEHLPLPTSAKMVEGMVTMNSSPASEPAPSSAPPAPGTTRAVIPGTFAVDFRPLGFEVSGSQAIAWYGSAPSLSIILRPDVDHGNVAIAGTQKGDEISGQWTLLGDSAHATGTVVLTRVKGNSAGR